jgi:hypothetical protein
MHIVSPTVGRKVWYRPTASDKAGNFGMACYGEQPLDATVIAVWGDRCVNLAVTDHAGKQFVRTSATLLQDGDPVPTDLEGKNAGGYAEWMPYQRQMAAKAEALEAASKA